MVDPGMAAHLRVAGEIASSLPVEHGRAGRAGAGPLVAERRLLIDDAGPHRGLRRAGPDMEAGEARDERPISPPPLRACSLCGCSCLRPPEPATSKGRRAAEAAATQAMVLLLASSRDMATKPSQYIGVLWITRRDLSSRTGTTLRTERALLTIRFECRALDGDGVRRPPESTPWCFLAHCCRRVWTTICKGPDVLTPARSDKRRGRTPRREPLGRCAA
jgi:hypothetical protein